VCGCFVVIFTLLFKQGPGASSIYGLVVELGPLWLNDLSMRDHDYNLSGVPQFVRNPYAWTKFAVFPFSKHVFKNFCSFRFASVLVVDSPPPVGFSYCTQYGPAANGTSCGAWNDTLTAEANVNFIIKWFGLFPEYKANEFFITGESYAGLKSFISIVFVKNMKFGCC
jgi:serine carboxypeptidase-like clade 1